MCMLSKPFVQSMYTISTGKKEVLVYICYTMYILHHRKMHLLTVSPVPSVCRVWQIVKNGTKSLTANDEIVTL